MLWFLIACGGDALTTDSSTTDTSDTWTYTGAVALDTASLSCADDVWTASLRTTGWASAAQLEMVDTDNTLMEAHPFPTQPTQWDPDGAWEERSLTLTMSDPAVLGASTQWGCVDEGTLSFQITLLDAAGAVLECRTWGAAPEALEEQGCSPL
jgi:hypothetical protein